MKKNQSINLQIRGVDVKQKEKAEFFVKKAGYPSLQAVLRVYIAELSNSSGLRTNLYIEDASHELIQSVQESRAEYARGEYKKLKKKKDIDTFINEIEDEIDNE